MLERYHELVGKDLGSAERNAKYLLLRTKSFTLRRGKSLARRTFEPTPGDENLLVAASPETAQKVLVEEHRGIEDTHPWPACCRGARLLVSRRRRRRYLVI